LSLFILMFPEKTMADIFLWNDNDYMFESRAAFGMMTPSFAENVPNITVVAGKDVVLPCVVDNLEHFKVKSIFICF
jgi:hypothetical protein